MFKPEDLIARLLEITNSKILASLLLTILDGQTVSGYGASVTFHLPAEKRKEILDEVFKNG